MYPTSPVAYGQTSADVTSLQNFLISQGMSIPAGATGYFGDQTKAALTQWQNSQGITGAGVGTNWGPQSIAAASSVNSSKAPVNQSVAPTPAPVQSTYTPAPVQSTYTPPPVTQAPVTQPTTQSAPASSSASAPYPTIALQPGSTNTAAVQQLQDFLVSQGMMTQAQVNTGYGTYGPQTTAAVLAFQQAEGIDNSSGPGYWGPKTIAAAPAYVSIHPTQTAVVYGQTPAGQTSAADTSSNLPAGVGPDGTAATSAANPPTGDLLPQLQPGTPEYNAAVDKLSTAYFDIMQQQMNASTESQQQAAQYNWDQLKNYTEQTLGVNLKNDASQAWDQVQGLKNQYGNLNLENSGIQNESVDDYLKKVRSNDSAMRTTAKTKEEEQQMNYYQNYATPEQIAAFSRANPQKAQQYGLTPSQAVKDAMNPAALKAKYPNMTDAEIQAAVASVMDTSGNYRSGLYQKYMVGSNVGANAGNVGTPMYSAYDAQGNGIGNPIAIPVTPADSGVLDINRAKSDYQKLNAPLNNPAATSGKPIIQPTSTQSQTPPQVVVPPSMTSSGSGQSSSSGSTNSNTSTPTPPTPSTPAAQPTPPAPAPTPTSTPAPAKTTYGTLYDYYTGTTGAYPTWNSTQRMADASKAGISNYTGTADQNAQLLSYLQK